MKNLLFGLSLLCLTSCATKYSYPTLTQITKIEVHGKNSGNFPFRAPVHWITDKQQIANAVDLFNAQRSNWENAEVVAPSPMPDTIVIFYSGKTEQDGVGVSSTFMTKFGTKQGNMIKSISANESKIILDAVAPTK